jgi:hypothetical protein
MRTIEVENYTETFLCGIRFVINLQTARVARTMLCDCFFSYTPLGKLAFQGYGIKIHTQKKYPLWRH